MNYVYRRLGLDVNISGVSVIWNEKKQMSIMILQLSGLSIIMTGMPRLNCCRIQPHRAHEQLPLCVTAIQWSQDRQTPIEIIDAPFDMPIIVGDILHIKKHCGGDWICGKVTDLTVMLQTCFIFEVALTPIPLVESTIFIAVPIYHAVKAEHMVTFQSFVNDLPTLPNLPHPYSLMAVQLEPKIPLLYATYNLYVIWLSAVH